MREIFLIFLFFILSICKVNSIHICAWERYQEYETLLREKFSLLNPSIPLTFLFTIDLEKISKNINLYKECDILMVEPLWMTQCKENYKDITSYVESTNLDRENDVADGQFYKDLMDDIKIDGDEKIYAVPVFSDFGILYYRNDIISSEPATWEELVDMTEYLDISVTNTKYIGQFNEYREFFYNFVEAIINNSDSNENEFYGENAKNTLDTFKGMFNKEIIDENAWNLNAELGKNRFNEGKAVIMRNWSTYQQNIYNSSITKNFSFKKARIPSGKEKSGSSITLARGLYFAISGIIQEDHLNDAIEVLKILTSKDYQNLLIQAENFYDIPVYLSLLEDNAQTTYCSRIDCEFYKSISQNVFTKSLSLYYKTDFSKRINRSYELIKTFFKRLDYSIDSIIKDMENIFKDKYIDWTDTVAIVIYVISGIGALATCAVIYIISKHKASLIIRRSSTLFLLIMLFGILISFLSIFTYIGKPSKFLCAFRPYVLVIAFGLTFFSLLIKTFRIKVIFDKSNIMVQDSNLLIYSGSLLLIELILLVIWTFTSRMEPTIKNISIEMHYFTCSNVGTTGTILQTILLVINGLTLLYGCYLAFKVKDVYTEYNESKVIGLSIYGIMICMVIQIIVASNEGLGHTTIFTIQSLMIILSSIIILTFMFVPKFWKLHITAISEPASENKSEKPISTSNTNNTNITNNMNPAIVSAKSSEKNTPMIYQMNSMVNNTSMYDNYSMSGINTYSNNGASQNDNYMRPHMGNGGANPYNNQYY